jgi:hypothetical protein
MPAQHRAIAFSTCCRVPVPLDATATLPGNLIDTEIMAIERPGLRIKLEYARFGDPGSAASAAMKSKVRIDGVPAVIRSGPAVGTGRVLLLTATLPAATERPAGGELTARAECATAAECDAARRILLGLRWI